MKTKTYIIPVYYMDYLVNGEAGDLTDVELATIEYWWNNERLEYVGMPDGEAYFSHHNDITGWIGGDVYECQCRVFKPRR